MAMDKAPSVASDSQSPTVAEKDATALAKRTSDTAEPPVLLSDADPAVASKLLHGPKLVGACASPGARGRC